MNCIYFAHVYIVLVPRLTVTIYFYNYTNTALHKVCVSIYKIIVVKAVARANLTANYTEKLVFTF